jgi:hypothetical protein
MCLPPGFLCGREMQDPIFKLRGGDGWDVRLVVVVQWKVCWWIVNSDVSFMCTRS